MELVFQTESQNIISSIKIIIKEKINEFKIKLD